MTARHFTGGQYFFPAPEKFEDKMELKSYEMDSSSVPTLKKILLTKTETSEEKFKVLDARDKLYKIMRDKDPTLKRSALVAVCPDMCPEKERLLRDYQARGSIFEMTDYSKNSAFNHNLAVKEYARSSADQEEPLPHDLRPVKVLEMTMSHLLHNVVDYCEISDYNLEEWYMFMWDRTRALRKELTQQGVCSLESVTLVEQCARFHIHCAERLIDQDISIYDDKINTENLTKCLQTLKYMYKDLAKEDIKCPNEPEFICYNLLLNLNNSSVFTELSNMSSSIMTSQPVKFALKVMTAWETKNYIRFFNLVKETTYLNCCLLRRYFGEMRLYAIKTMIRSYCTKTYSPQIVLSRFVENLNFEGEEECISFLSQCHFNFVNLDGKKAVNFDRVLFQNPKAILTYGRAFLFIEEKKQQPLSVVMAGGCLPPKLFENYTPQNSFLENGMINPETLPKNELFDLSSTSSIRNSGFEFKTDSQKTELGIDVSQKEEPSSDFTFDQKATKKFDQPTSLPHGSLFGLKDKSFLSSNIFGSSQNSTFGKLPAPSNIFNTNVQSEAPSQPQNIFESSKTQFSKNLFSQESSNLFGNNKGSIFGSKPDNAPTFSFSIPPKTEPQRMGLFESLKPPTSFQFKPEAPSLKEEQERKEKLEKEKLEEKRIQEQKGEEERRRKEEEEKARLLEEKRRKEEMERLEREKLEKQKREEEERRKKAERERLEREEQIRKEEKARQDKIKEENAKRLAELKKEEEKRRIVLENQRRVDNKMSELKKKYEKWKTKIVFEKWRTKTWTKIEERKMKEYFREVKEKYPPVCTEEALDGNPYGLLIPSILTFEKFRNWKKELVQKTSKKLLIVSHDLPLLKLDSILGKLLEERAKSFENKLNPFPWKVVLSVPNEEESPEYWKSIETFVEMHFVDNFHWQFGLQDASILTHTSGCQDNQQIFVGGEVHRSCLQMLSSSEGNRVTRSSVVSENLPLRSNLYRGITLATTPVKNSQKSNIHSTAEPQDTQKTTGALNIQNGSRGAFQFKISIRRLRGDELYEGCEPNPLATTGCNALIFFVIENGNKHTNERLKAVLKSRAPLPKIPVTIINLCEGSKQEEDIGKTLKLDLWKKSHISEFNLISVVDKKPELVAQLIRSLQLSVKNSAPPSTLRITKLTNFFMEIWLDSVWRRIEISLSNFKVILREPRVLLEFYNSCFENLKGIFFDPKYENQTILAEEFSTFPGSRPQVTASYREKVLSLFNELKLPHWPAETPKSSHQLNYRIHQYCKKIVDQDKMKLKNLKWVLYRIIRRSLLWKGLDIYCDEDINDILINFPWIQFFQEISRVMVRQLQENPHKEITVVYDPQKVENLNFESSLISKFIQKPKRQSLKKLSEAFEEEPEELNPCVEKDSIVYAYSSAIEKESSKRKREECIDESLDALFSSPAGKRIVLEEEEEEEEGRKDFDWSKMKSNFQSLNDRLDGIKRLMMENSKTLMDIQNQLQ